MSSKSAPSQTFGQVAIEQGFLSADQLSEGLRLQKKLKTMGLRETLGEILVKKGFLSADQVKEILRTQGRRSGTQIPGYKILEKLGAGGMGAVYKATQLSMDRPVAIKVLAKEMASKEDARERFLREGRMTARLNHPHIVTAYNVGQAGAFYFLVMEYVEGESLADRVKREGRLPEAVALPLWLQIASALDHADRNGLIHRDVKPGNILLTDTGQAKLADLGLARPADPSEDPEITMPGTTIGTPWYISPEQAQGRSDLDIRTDIYSLGASFYHVLTGKPPFEGPSGAAILAMHLTDPPVPPDHLAKDLSNATCRIILRCLEKHREERYDSCAGLVADLEDAIDSRSRPSTRRSGPPSSRRSSASQARAPRRSRPSTRYRKKSSTGLYLTLALIAGFLMAVLFIAFLFAG